MPEHVPQPCGEGNATWLPLIDYSIRTGVSLSTVRRKIKSNSIPYRLEKGRYLIFYPGAVLSVGTTAPSSEVEHPPVLVHDSVRLAGEAFEQALTAKDDRIKLLERKNRELEAQLTEMSLLVQVLEEKYEVRY